MVVWQLLPYCLIQEVDFYYNNPLIIQTLWFLLPAGQVNRNNWQIKFHLYTKHTKVIVEES